MIYVIYVRLKNGFLLMSFCLLLTIYSILYQIYTKSQPPLFSRVGASVDFFLSWVTRHMHERYGVPFMVTRYVCLSATIDAPKASGFITG